MANILYRTSTTPTTPVSTTAKGAALTNLEVDANFKSLSNDVDLKAPINSPTLTGTPLSPTAAAATNTTQIATTAHVFAERTNAATLTNKTLTSPTLTTPILTNPDNTSFVLTDAATTTWNMNTGHVARWTIAASRTLATPTNYKTGGQYVLILGNNNPASFTVTWPAIIAWPYGTPPNLTTSSWTVITLVWSIEHSKFLGSYTPGY